MNKPQITEAGIRRNVTWIEAVEKALATHGNTALAGEVMRVGGQKCARQILDDCAETVSNKPETVDELLDASNQRRLPRHDLASPWAKQGNKARLKIDACACGLVKAGLAKSNPGHRLCSVGLMEGYSLCGLPGAGQRGSC